MLTTIPFIPSQESKTPLVHQKRLRRSCDYCPDHLSATSPVKMNFRMSDRPTVTKAVTQAQCKEWKTGV